MKKLMTLLMVLTIVVGLFTACGKEETKTETSSTTTEKKEESKGETETTEEKEEVKEPVKMVIALNKMPEAISLKTALEEIQKDPRYSHVEFEILPSSEDYNTTLPITVAAGEQRDLVALANPIIQTSWATAGVIQPIDAAIAEAGYDYDSEYGAYAANAMVNGETFAIPNEVTKWALYYNKAVFDAAGEAYPDQTTPMTWTEYTELAARLTSGSGQEKVYGAFHLTWPMFWYGEAIMKLGGGEYFYNAEGLSNIEDPIFAHAMERSASMMHDDKSTQSHADLVSSKTTPTAFMNGQYGMTIAGGWILSWATDSENHPRDWEIGIAPMPVDAGTTPKTWGIVNGFGVSASSANPALATEIGIEITRLSKIYTEAQEVANQNGTSDKLFVGIGEKLGGEGVTTEVIKGVMANPATIFVTEKVMGPNNVAYEQVLKEETALYFVGEQDLATTIAKIKERGDKAILDN